MVFCFRSCPSEQLLWDLPLRLLGGSIKVLSPDASSVDDGRSFLVLFKENAVVRKQNRNKITPVVGIPNPRLDFGLRSGRGMVFPAIITIIYKRKVNALFIHRPLSGGGRNGRSRD